MFQSYDWIVSSRLIYYLLSPQTNAQVTCIGALSLGAAGPAVESVAFLISVCIAVPSWQGVRGASGFVYIQPIDTVANSFS